MRFQAKKLTKAAEYTKKEAFSLLPFLQHISNPSTSLKRPLENMTYSNKVTMSNLDL